MKFLYRLGCALGLFLLLGTACALFILRDQPTRISVTNRSSSVLKDVQVIGIGFSERWETLQPNETVRVTPRFSGESGLRVKFVTASGMSSKGDLAYVERYNYYANVTILQNLGNFLREWIHLGIRSRLLRWENAQHSLGNDATTWDTTWENLGKLGKWRVAIQHFPLFPISKVAL